MYISLNDKMQISACLTSKDLDLDHNPNYCKLIIYGNSIPTSSACPLQCENKPALEQAETLCGP